MAVALVLNVFMPNSRAKAKFPWKVMVDCTALYGSVVSVFVH